MGRRRNQFAIPSCLLRTNESIGPQRRMTEIEDRMWNARYAGLSIVPVYRS